MRIGAGDAASAQFGAIACREDHVHELDLVQFDGWHPQTPLPFEATRRLWVFLVTSPETAPPTNEEEQDRSAKLVGARSAGTSR